jgi:hypothetical protein
VTVGSGGVTVGGTLANYDTLQVTGGNLTVSGAGASSNAGTIRTVTSGTQGYTGAMTNTGSITGVGLVTFSSSLTSGGSLTVGTGGLLVSGVADFTGGTVVGCTTGDPNWEFRNNLTFTAGSTVTSNGDVLLFDQGTGQLFTTGGKTFGPMTVNKTAATVVQTSGSLTVSTLTMTQGTFTVNSADTLTLTAAPSLTGGTLNLTGALSASGVVFTVAGTIVTAGTNAFTAGAMTVSSGSFTQTGGNVSTITSLNVTGSGSCTWGAGSLAVAGVITQNGGSLAFGAKSTTVGDDVTISAGTLDLGSGALSLTTSGKSITVTPAFSLTANGASIATNNGNASFTGAINDTYSLSVNVGSGKALFSSALGQTNALASLAVTSTNAAADAIEINSIRTSGVQNYSGNVTLATAPTTTLQGAVVTLGGNVAVATANINLTVTGSAVLGAAVGNALAGIGALSVSGTTTVNAGSITTVLGGQTYTGAVTLASNTSLTSTGGGLSFSATIDGPTSLTLDSGGTISVAGAVGGLTALTTLVIADSTTTTFTDNVRVGTMTLTSTTGAITVNGNLVVTTGMSAAAAVSDLALNQGAGAQTSTIAGSTVLANSGTLALGNAALDSITFTGGLNAITQTATTFQGTVATGGANGQDVTLNRLDVGAAGLTMNLGLGDLAVTAGAATMTVSNANATVNAALVNLGTLSIASTRTAKFAASAASGLTIATANVAGPNTAGDVATNPSDTGAANGILDLGASNFTISTLNSTGILQLTGEQLGVHTVTNNGSTAGIIEYYDGLVAGTVFDDIVSAAPNYYHLRISGSAQAFTVNGNISVAADVILDGGTLALGSTTMTVGGYWINNDSSSTMSSGTSTVRFIPNAARLAAPYVIKIYGDNTWWIFWCESPGAVILFENDRIQRIVAGGIFDVKGTAGSHMTLSRLYRTLVPLVAGTEIPANLPDSSDNPSKPPLGSESQLFWKFDMAPSANFAMDYVDVFYSDASSNPVAIPPNVYAVPYDEAVAPQVDHYSFKWLSYLFAMYSYTEDSDYNGKIDRIRVTTEGAVGNDFSGFVAEVQGYTVTGYSRPTANRNFYILLQEKPYLDTGVTPDWRVVSNTTLVDSTYESQYVWTLSRAGGSEWMTPGDTAWPVVGYSLALPGLAAGLPDTYLHFSEPVVTSTSGKPMDADLGLSGTPLYTTLSGSGNGVQTVVGRSAAGLTIANIADNSTYIAFTPTLMDMGSPPHWEDAYNNQIIGPDGPKYPPTTGYTADPDNYDEALPKPDTPFTVTLSRPDFRLQDGAGKTTHRASDVLISVPPSTTYPSSYFVWPIWAKDQVSLSLTDAEITALTPLETAQMGPGLIRAFDGTQWLRDQDITLQAKVAAGLTSPIMYFDSKQSSALMTSAGLWLPAFNEANTITETGFSGLVPYSDQPPLGRGAQTLAGTQISVPANLWNFAIPSTDPRVVSVSTFGFFFTVTPSAPVGQQPLYCARLAIDAGTAIPSYWYALVRPFSFDIHDLTLQRGSVTILNNVIDPTKGETVRLNYTLAEAGATTITVFTLDGDVVKRLYMGTEGAGNYSVSWDGTNLAGLPVARGVYFIRVVAPGIDEIRKVMIIRR